MEEISSVIIKHWPDQLTLTHLLLHVMKSRAHFDFTKGAPYVMKLVTFSDNTRSSGNYSNLFNIQTQ